MHLLRTESHSLDATAAAIDLEQTPGDIVFLSFTDSDLSGLATAYEEGVGEFPSLRMACLAQLKHPYSVDLYLERMAPKVRLVLVRLLGGLDYWRYGIEELARLARKNGFELAVVPGDYRQDPRCDEASTVSSDDLKRLWLYFHEGGAKNFTNCLKWIANRIGTPTAWSAPEAIPAMSLFDAACHAGENGAPRALLVVYRSIVIAADTAPVLLMAKALWERGFAVDCVAVSSLKDPAASDSLAVFLDHSPPDVILNMTAFSGRQSDGGGVLDRADAPVLQVILSTTWREPWQASERGLTTTDLAMNVVLPEFDGRIITRAISFKGEAERRDLVEFTRVIHSPEESRIGFVADLALSWAGLRRKPNKNKRVACVLSDYPAKGGRQGYAVGLDTPESVIRISEALKLQGYSVRVPQDSAALMKDLISGPLTKIISLSEYQKHFDLLPEAFRRAVEAVWGAVRDAEVVSDGFFSARFMDLGGLIVALQPDRGHAVTRKDTYHDGNIPPHHAYIAFYIWLRETLKIDAMVHLGTHGTLEWLPGKSVALSEFCAPEVVLGPVPVIYPFIVNNPGEAAQAKRRLAAVTIGHLTPPLKEAGAHGVAAEIESLLEEYAEAQGLDQRRARLLADAIIERATESGLIAEAGIDGSSERDDLLMTLDAWLCDLKEMRIADGLHVFGASFDAAVLDERSADLASIPGIDLGALRTQLSVCGTSELEGFIKALEGKFIEPGPSGAPSRGRVDVLPTGRNLFSVDPRSIPTRTAWEIGRRTADEVVNRYVQDHGDWPRSVLIDLWGSATMRTGGDDLAQAMALIGVRPLWDEGSSRISGFEILPPAVFGRPRIDVTLRISGLFRDVFQTQIALFDEAVQAVSLLDETVSENPIAAKRRDSQLEPFRIFGNAPGDYGIGMGRVLSDNAVAEKAELGAAYLTASSYAYRANEDGISAPDAFRERVAAADAFVHVQDMSDQDVLDSDAFADHEGGFVAAAALLDNAPSIFHVDATRSDQQKVRTLSEEIARIVRGRATNPRWINGQMRHGHRGASEIAETVNNLFSFAVATDFVTSGQFDMMFEATLGNERVRQFLMEANPEAGNAIARNFASAVQRGFWVSRRNSTAAILSECGIEVPEVLAQ